MTSGPHMRTHRPWSKRQGSASLVTPEGWTIRRRFARSFSERATKRRRARSGRELQIEDVLRHADHR
jgi:hypothetical protein